MTRIPLCPGALRVDGYRIVRSDIRWLCEDGQWCRANEVVGYCTIALVRQPGWSGPANPFQDEHTTQVAFAPRVAGTIAIHTGAARGGYLNITALLPWDDGEIVAHIDAADEDSSQADAGSLRLLLLTGRRMTALADVHSGLLPGWNGRSRGWWCEPGETPRTLLSLGLCDVTGVVIGEQCAFLELFESERRPTHVVFVPDHPLAPCAPVLLDGLRRTSADMDAIDKDLQRFLAASATVPTGDDLMFAGSLLSVMRRNPIADTYTAFSGSGTLQLQPAAAILLSLISEPSTILRHKQLGYRIHVLRHHQKAAGPVMRDWFGKSFETVRRSTDDIRRDYLALIDAVARATGARLLILNRMSTSGFEDISSYAPFDAPLGDTLANVAAKEQNLMLHDLCAEREVYLIDVDAIGADLGGTEHLPDGIHQSEPLQQILRRQILDILNHLDSRTAASPAPGVR